jgi:hypothetical protein
VTRSAVRDQLGQFTYARLCVFVGGDERDEPEPGRIGQCLESAGQLLGLSRLNDIAYQGRAAFGQQRGSVRVGVTVCTKPSWAYIDKYRWETARPVASTILNANEDDHDSERDS